VLELQKREPQFKEYASTHTKLEYLGSVTSKTLWRFFRNSIPWVHLALVFELEQDSIDLFSQLKLVSI
jgi:hypothetical protein